MGGRRRDASVRELLHGGEFVMVADAELGKELPLGVPKHLDKEEPGAGGSLADGLGLPALARLDVKKVVAEMVFAEGGGIRSEMLVNQPHGAVVAVPGARGVVAQGEQLGIAPNQPAAQRLSSTQGSTMRRIRHGAQQPLVENCKRSSRGYTDQFWLGGPMLALIATLTPNRTYISSQLSRGSTCRRIRYRRFSQPGGLWADCRHACVASPAC